MFISSAFAQTVASSGVSDSSKMIVNLILLFVIFYLFLIRPQQKKVKKHEAQLKAITTGDAVIISGIVGKVVRVIDEDKLEVEIAKDTHITVIRGYVSAVLTKEEGKK